jgi:hypothetical protein
MTQPNYDHRQDLMEQALECLDRYTDFKSDYKVSFSLDGGTGRLAARLERSDGVPLAQGTTETDRKLAKLKDQTVVIRPFFLPMCSSPWKDEDASANLFSQVDFDYAAILGYKLDDQGKAVLHALYYPSTDALLFRRQPGEDGLWRIPIATFNAFHLSLDPRKKFAKFLYLAERMSEALAYQIDKAGYFFSNPNP